MDNPLGDPPDVPVLIFYPALPIAVRHVADFHLKHRSMFESPLHRGICILDVQLVGSSHGLISFRRLTDHHSRGAQFDLDVLNQPVWSNGAAGFSPAKPLHQEAHE